MHLRDSFLTHGALKLTVQTANALGANEGEVAEGAAGITGILQKKVGALNGFLRDTSVDKLDDVLLPCSFTVGQRSSSIYLHLCVWIRCNSNWWCPCSHRWRCGLRPDSKCECCQFPHSTLDNCLQKSRFQQILYLVSDTAVPGGIGIQLDVYRTAGTTGAAASLNPVAAGKTVMEYITSYYAAIQNDAKAIQAAYVRYICFTFPSALSHVF